VLGIYLSLKVWRDGRVSQPETIAMIELGTYIRLAVEAVVVAFSLSVFGLSVMIASRLWL
jgi:hypothetical protein